MTTLCLACSSSLLTKASDSVFITACCSQPICTTCIQSNPRLARYNPCLACLGGVAAVGAAASSKSDKKDHRNVDGAVRDEDTFAIGDDDDPESDSELPPYTSLPASAKAAARPVHNADPSSQTSPGTYYIKPGDTLPGIALRFRVDGRTLCRLNKLPPSTLSTTPHLLHTRTSLQLPPSAFSQLSSMDATPSPVDVHAREVSRAGKRLQMLTKETDWRIARAYVALADDPEESASFALKRKELGNTPAAVGSAGSSLDAVATDRYLDDLEWEAEQLKAGRPIRINPFPMNPIPTQNSSSKIKARSWW